MYKGTWEKSSNDNKKTEEHNFLFYFRHLLCKVHVINKILVFFQSIYFQILIFHFVL